MSVSLSLSLSLTVTLLLSDLTDGQVKVKVNLSLSLACLWTASIPFPSSRQPVWVTAGQLLCLTLFNFSFSTSLSLSSFTPFIHLPPLFCSYLALASFSPLSFMLFSSLHLFLPPSEHFPWLIRWETAIRKPPGFCPSCASQPSTRTLSTCCATSTSPCLPASRCCRCSFPLWSLTLQMFPWTILTRRFCVSQKQIDHSCVFVSQAQ